MRVLNAAGPGGTPKALLYGRATTLSAHDLFSTAPKANDTTLEHAH